MRKIISLLLCLILSMSLCACSLGKELQEEPHMKYQGTWVYDKYSNDLYEVRDILTIEGTNATYTRESRYMGATNTIPHANYKFEVQNGVECLIYIDGYGIKTPKWELSISGNEIIAKSTDETVRFKKQ